MDTKIKILPEFIANQIAAGEVVQRPESVVKELVENSIDANADTIAVIVRNAGKSLIHIVDNGIGMSSDDLVLSVRRHATSKVFTSEDLESIKTFGFRGEALASVCSVANVEIRTKTKNEPHGWQLISEPLKPEIVNPVNTDNGTQIFVRNLFYNVPARKKFLKSNMTEFRYISDTMIKFALAKPNIRFIFYDDDVLIFDVKPNSLTNRIYDILGNQVTDKLLPLQYKDEFVQLSGFLGMPELAKMNRTGQYFFLNGRSIFSASLSHAVSSVFENILDRNQKPLFIINIEVDYSKVDVNVHPQKHEVKFEDERYIYNCIKTAASKSLSGNLMIPEFDLIGKDAPFIQMKNEEGQSYVNKITGEIISQNSGQKNSGNFPGYRNFDTNFSGNENYNPRDSKKFETAFDLLFNSNIKSELFQNKDTLNPIQIFNRFILVINDSEMLIYDQNSVHQRVIFDNLKKGVVSANTQQLLFPYEIEITQNGLTFINEIREVLNNCGYFFSIDGNRLSFSEVPDLLIKGQENTILQNMLNSLLEIPFISNNDVLFSSYKVLAENTAIRSGQKLNRDEMLSLIESLEKCEDKFTSPSGKRTFSRLTSEQLYQKLLRF